MNALTQEPLRAVLALVKQKGPEATFQRGALGGRYAEKFGRTRFVF